MTKILITGASGFIGTSLYKKLSCDNEFDVHVISRNEIFFPRLSSHGIQNYSNVDELISVIKKIQPEIIIHAGADMNATTIENSFTKNLWKASLPLLKKFI